MTIASSVKSLGIYWLIPRRHRVIAKLVHGLFYLKILEKIRFVREIEIYNTVINVENTRLGTIDSYYLPLGKDLKEGYYQLSMLIDKILDYMKENGLDRIGKMPIESTIYFRGMLFDEPFIGYVKARYRLSESKSKGDIELDVIEILRDSNNTILLGEAIAEAYNQGIIKKEDISTILESALYSRKYMNIFLKAKEINDFIEKSMSTYSEKIIVIANQPKPLKRITSRYGLGVKDIQTLASEMREFLKEENIQYTHKQGREVYEAIKPVLLPYRLDYIKPLFTEAKEYIVTYLNQQNIPVVKTSSLIVFDNKPLYSLTYSIAKGLLTVLNQKYKRILEGSKVAWDDISRIRIS